MSNRNKAKKEWKIIPGNKLIIRKFYVSVIIGKEMKLTCN